MKQLTVPLLLCILAIILMSGCLNQSPSNIELVNSSTIIIDKEGPLPQKLCEKHNISNNVIIIESKYCGACKKAVPLLREIEQELNATFIFLDLSKEEDAEYIRELKITPKYTPTIFVGCDVIIGLHPKDYYKQKIELFLNESS